MAGVLEFVRLPVFLVVLAAVVATSLPVNEAPKHCTAEQESTNPCRCCKMGCWYTIAQAATHELGHMPGQAGEEEALATLKLIRACMMVECGDFCPRRSPFAPEAGFH